MKRAQPPLFQNRGRQIAIAIALAGLCTFLPFRIPPAVGQAVDSIYSVSIVDYAFQPLHVNITTGTTVVWTYTSSGTDFHTVTSSPGTNQTEAHTPLLNSGSLNPGQSSNYTFNQPGFYPYQCSFHPTIQAMNGWVMVTGLPVTPRPSPGPGFPLLLVVGIVAVIAASVFFLLTFTRRRTRSTASGKSPPA